MRRVLAGVALVTAVTVTPAAQQRPVFRAAVDLVTVDVTVVGADGTLLSTLSRDDFQLSVDGSPRPIVWSEFVPHRTTRTAAGAADHFSTNEAATPGRLVVIAVDQTHIRRIE